MSGSAQSAEIARIRAAIDKDEAAVNAEITAHPTPSGWLGPLRDTYGSHRRLLTLADEYRPELEHGDNGEWAFEEVVRVLGDLYQGDPRPRSDCPVCHREMALTKRGTVPVHHRPSGQRCSGSKRAISVDQGEVIHSAKVRAVGVDAVTRPGATT